MFYTTQVVKLPAPVGLLLRTAEEGGARTEEPIRETRGWTEIAQINYFAIKLSQNSINDEHGTAN